MPRSHSSYGDDWAHDPEIGWKVVARLRWLIYKTSLNYSLVLARLDMDHPVRTCP